MKENILTRILALFLMILVVIAAMAAYSLRTINRSVASSDWVNHTHATIYELENITASLLQGEGYTQTYTLTGDARDLATARGAFARLGEHFDTAKALTRDDPAANAALLRIEALVQAREELARSLWAARSSDQPAQVRSLLEHYHGSVEVVAIERGIAKLRDTQFELLRERDQASYLQAQTTRWTVGAGIALNFLLLAAVGWLLRNDIAARRRIASAMTEANAQLEDKVRARTAELEQANNNLRAENLERKWTIVSQEHQLRYNRLIVESVEDLVFVLTKICNVTRINAAVVHLTGLEDVAILAKPLGQIIEIAPDTSTGLNPLARALEEGRELHHHPVVVVARNQRRIPAQLSLIPLRDQDRVVGGVAVVHLGSSATSSAL